MLKKFFIATLILAGVSFASFAQDNTKIGIRGTLQQNDYGISVPIWMGEKFVLSPSLMLTSSEGIGTNFGLALAPRFYLSTNKVAPYFGLKAGAIFGMPPSDNEEAESTVDIMAGAAFGGEYFLSDNFSFGVEIQGNFTKSDDNSFRFGNPGKLNFNTGTAVSATVYF